MDAMIWMFLPLFTAAGSALLAFYIMQARMEVLVAKEREALIEAQANARNAERELEDKVRVAEEETRRRSLDDFFNDIRVEERHYMRENRSQLHSRKSMVLQERLYFRNIPLSNWIEHELVVEEGGDTGHLVKSASVFAGQSLTAGTKPKKQVKTSETTDLAKMLQ
jgi:hypothetical protein